MLAAKKPANGFLMRGIAHQPEIPLFEDRYKLKPACLAVYPMYKGLAQLVGMKKIEGPQSIAEQFERYLKEYDNYDYFFIHYKYTDMFGGGRELRGEGKRRSRNSTRRCRCLLAKAAGRAGDHGRPFDAVPAEGHSWHPQPVLLTSACSGWDKLDRSHGDGGELRFAGGVRGEVPDPADAGGTPRMFDKFGA